MTTFPAIDLEVEAPPGVLTPTPEQTLFRMAIERALSPLQSKIWEYWNYDRLTQKEISRRLRLGSASNAAHRIKTIERALERYCNAHRFDLRP